jgi:hypothetical protein
MLPASPKAKALLGDKGYDAGWFRAALAERGVAACIPSKSNRKVAIPYGLPSPVSNSCIGLEKVSSHSEGYESKTIGRQQSGMQFSPPEPRNDPERSFH